MQAGKWFNTQELTGKKVIMYRCTSHTSFTFYSNAEIKYADTINADESSYKVPAILYGEKKQIDSLASKGFSISVLKSFPYFHTSKLNIKFISSKTRNAQLQTFELAEINKK